MRRVIMHEANVPVLFRHGNANSSSTFYVGEWNDRAQCLRVESYTALPDDSHPQLSIGEVEGFAFGHLQMYWHLGLK